MTRTLIAVSAIAWFTVAPAAAGELAWDAKALFGRSVTRDVRLSADGSAIELESSELIEDDGPAAGYSYRSNEEKLSDRVWVQKDLVLSDPRARAVTLLVGPGGVGLKATINGRAVELPPARKAGAYWESFPIPAGVLKAGPNSIVLHGGGKVWIARAEDFAAGSTDRPKHPGRSARSADGGITWNPDRLGPAGDIRGEYCVRLFLDRHRGGGSLTLPVFDSGNLTGRVVAPPSAAFGPVRVSLTAEAGPSGRIAVRVRTGPTPTPDAKTWSDWQSLEPTGGVVRGPHGRYVQIAVELQTTDPLATPRVKSVRIETAARGETDWAAAIKAVDGHNEEIVRTSIPFAYEPFDHPRLKDLRTRFKLDDVVRGAKDELEVMARLARWSAGRWERGHLKDAYPPWDALEILKPHADGTPVGGFCQQYNVVFLQACESFGIPGRAVSIGPGSHVGKIRGGHEVVEVWSNQFKKWIYIDGDMAWYAVDAKTDVPLSLLDLHRRQVSAVQEKPYEPIRVVELAEAKRRWTGLTDWPPFLELRLVPRSNFLEQPAPLPLNQGMRGWFWTGHHAWTEPDSPAALLYGHRVADRRTWEWTLNQAHMTLEATVTPGEVRVHLDTETPGFETFLAATDGRAAERVASGFVWKFHSGKNHLDVRPRNVLGREGIASRVTLDAP